MSISTYAQTHTLSRFAVSVAEALELSDVVLTLSTNCACYSHGENIMDDSHTRHRRSCVL